MANCLEYDRQRTESCEQYADQGYSACAQYRDEGYNSCGNWSPWFRWLCIFWYWVSDIVCVAWTWISSVVCVLWTMVTTLVCAVWEIVVTVVSVIVTLLEAGLGWALSFLAMIFEFIFAIPYIGRILQWIWNVIVLNLVWLTVNVIDATLYVVGVRPQKKLRICTIILRDERGNPVAGIDDVVDLINDAIDILLRECNVQIVNSAPMQFSTGLSFDPVRADGSWVRNDPRPSRIGLLDSACDQLGFSEDLGDVGSDYQLKGTTNCFFGNWRNVVGLGTPVTVLIVRSITRPKSFSGCCLWVGNYLTISADPNLFPGQRPNRTLAHELEHACNLWHLTDAPNLMDVSSTGPSGSLLRFWQEALLRASRHVSYL